MFEKTSDFILKHSKAIIAVWIVVLICAIPPAMQAGDVLKYDVTEMSGDETESVAGMRLINSEFPDSVNLAEILVIPYGSPEELAKVMPVYALFEASMSEKYPTQIGVSYYGEYGSDSADSGVALVVISLEDKSFDITRETGSIRELVSEAKEAAGAGEMDSYVTGPAAIAFDTEKSSLEDVKKVDPLSVALIFILLGLFFLALVTAMVPPAVVGMAYGIALAALFGIGSVIDVFYITKMLVLVTMLGAGCDYALFIITRYRDERKHGTGHEDALRAAVQWAGESVFTSGLAVIIGFGALSICSFSLVKSLGLVLATGILIALIAALTFIPSLVNVLGEKIFWPSDIDNYKKVENGTKKGVYASLCGISRRYFGWLAEATHKYALPVVAVWLVVSVPALYFFATAEDSSDMVSIMPESESLDGLNAMMEYTDGGTIMPTYVVIELNYPIAEKTDVLNLGGNEVPYLIWKEDTAPGAVMQLNEIRNSIIADHSDIVGTAAVPVMWEMIYKMTAQKIGSADPAAVNGVILSSGMIPAAVQPALKSLIGPGAPFNAAPYTSPVAPGVPVTVANVIDGVLNYGTGLISADGSFVKMMLITSEKPMSDNTMVLMDNLKDEFHGENGYDGMSAIKETHITGSSAIMNEISAEVEQQFSVIRIAVAVLLMVLLFFIVGSYLTPLRSIITIMMSIIWTISLTHLVFSVWLDIPVLWLVPIVLFVVLLGLGMDYDIFITTRIRENVLSGMSNGDAIKDAVRKGGPVTSLCALIMGGTFLTLLLTGSSLLQEFGFALGAGILIEGFITVGFVVPAMMHLMGDWNWKGPAFLSRKKKLSEE